MGLETKVREVKIPYRTEDPANSYKVLKLWISEFCEMNGKDLPKNYHKKNMKQLVGMYRGIKRYSHISTDDIIGPSKKIS